MYRSIYILIDAHDCDFRVHKAICYIHPWLCMYIQGLLRNQKGWSGGAMVLGKLPVPGSPTYLE